MCVCVCTTYNRHCPSPSPTMGRPGISHPHSSDYRGPPQTSRGKPGPTWADPGKFHSCSQTHWDKKSWGNAGSFFKNCSLYQIKSKTAFESDENGVSSKGAEAALNVNDPLANSHSRSLQWVMSTLYPPAYRPPLCSRYCLCLKLMLGERGARMGEGRAGLSTPGPLFLSDPHSGSFSMRHL